MVERTNSALATAALLTQSAIASVMSEKGVEVFAKLIADLNGNPEQIAGSREAGDDGTFKPPVRSGKKDPRIPDSPGRRKIKPRPKDELLS